MAQAQTRPFNGYIGKRVLFRHTTLEIVNVDIRDRAVCFVGRETNSEREILVPLRDLLEHIIEEAEVSSAVPY